jgi:hypothetical protein
MGGDIYNLPEHAVKRRLCTGRQPWLRSHLAHQRCVAEFRTLAASGDCLKKVSRLNNCRTIADDAIGDPFFWRSPIV